MMNITKASTTVLDKATPGATAEPHAGFVSRCVEYLRHGAKPVERWACGLEVEVFGYHTMPDYARLSPTQVQTTLAHLGGCNAEHAAVQRFVYEDETLIGIHDEEQGQVTIEPGGQVEFSDVPQTSLRSIERALEVRFAQLREISARKDFIFIAAGFDPLSTLEQQRWFPKRRYAVMRPYVARHGTRGWDMMTRTCAVQVNLDYADDDDLAKKFLVGNCLAPIVTAMFANSPFADGKVSAYKSTRAATWLQTDAARCLIAAPAIFDQPKQVAAMSLDEFVAYTFDVPMLLLRRGDEYSALPDDTTFGEFLGRDKGMRCMGHEPEFSDWVTHISTIFTDARLKQYIELRSADGGNMEMTLALAALWKGLLYDPDALEEAQRLAPKLTHANAIKLRESVARDALQAKSGGIDVLALAKELVALATAGLQHIAPDEVRYLEVLHAQVIDEEICPADILLRNWHGSWHGSIPKLMQYLRVA